MATGAIGAGRIPSGQLLEDQIVQNVRTKGS